MSWPEAHRAEGKGRWIVVINDERRRGKRRRRERHHVCVTHVLRSQVRREDVVPFSELALEHLLRELLGILGAFIAFSRAFARDTGVVDSVISLAQSMAEGVEHGEE
jgi:hypothetical protein